MTNILLAVVFALLAAGLAPSPLALGQDGQVPLIQVPLTKDLVIVTAVQWPDGDYESLKRVVAVSDRNVTITVSAEAPPVQGDPLDFFGGSSAGGAKGEPRRVNARRIVRREDLQSAHEYVQRFWEDAPATFPGTTAVGVSSAVLSELKSKGTTKLTVVDQRSSGRSLDGLLGSLAGDAPAGASGRRTITGTLNVVKGGPGTMSVLVNGSPTPLRVVHAAGELDGVKAELFILDDPANPLSLQYSFGDVHLDVVRLDYPVQQSAAAPAKTIERQLAAAGKADVYGIYFDFASDRIKPESEPVLIEIARALADNPAWKLTIEGHTDNLGGDGFNLDLSRRRAASVKGALIGSHKVTAARLSTNGFGAGRPKDTNGTLANRARNRRVELVRHP